MGQPITVVEKSSRNPGIARFEINRSLTGMGHERYSSVDDVLADRPVDELARRLFATGLVASLHANGSVITIQLADGASSDGLAEVIRGLYIFYPEERDAAGEAEAADDSAASDAPGEAATTPRDDSNGGSSETATDATRVSAASDARQ